MCGDDVTIPAEGGSQNHTFSIKPVADFLPYGVTFLYDSVFIDKIQKSISMNVHIHRFVVNSFTCELFLSRKILGTRYDLLSISQLLWPSECGVDCGQLSEQCLPFTSATARHSCPTPPRPSTHTSPLSYNSCNYTV